MSIIHCPPELLNMVFGYVDTKDLMALCEVCTLLKSRAIDVANNKVLKDKFAITVKINEDSRAQINMKQIDIRRAFPFDSYADHYRFDSIMGVYEVEEESLENGCRFKKFSMQHDQLMKCMDELKPLLMGYEIDVFVPLAIDGHEIDLLNTLNAACTDHDVSVLTIIIWDEHLEHHRASGRARVMAFAKNFKCNTIFCFDSASIFPVDLILRFADITDRLIVNRASSPDDSFDIPKFVINLFRRRCTSIVLGNRFKLDKNDVELVKKHICEMGKSVSVYAAVDDTMECSLEKVGDVHIEIAKGDLSPIEICIAKNINQRSMYLPIWVSI